MAKRPIEERFWEKVDRRGPDECWPWIGANDRRRGYGMIYHNGRSRKATHVSWEIANGKPFPAGAMACHSCDNPPCVNPAHLWPGTMSENILDAVRKGRVKPPPEPGWQGRLTHCKRGHPLSGDNLAPAIGRKCRICQREHNRRYKQRRRIARQALGSTDNVG